MIIALSPRQVKQLTKNFDILTNWIRDHAELCEEEDELKRVNKAARKAGEIIDLLEAGDPVEGAELTESNSIWPKDGYDHDEPSPGYITGSPMGGSGSE